MSDETIVRVKLKPDGSVWQIMPDGSLQPYEEEMNWERFNALTDDEIEAAARSDPDNLPLTEEELAQMMRVPNLQAIREKLGLSPEAFADRFALNPSQVRRWEAREEHASWETDLYLRVIDIHPEAVDDAIRAYRSPRAIPNDEVISEPPAPMPGKRRKSA